MPDMETLLTEYYRARGWDEVSGMPTAETLIRLNLQFTQS